jgi:transposase-like protein
MFAPYKLYKPKGWRADRRRDPVPIHTQEYLAGETLHGLSNRHDISRQLIRVWVEKYQAGALDEDVAAADLLQTYEARIAALERLVGKQALALEFLKGALRPGPVPRRGSMSAIAGPRASASPSGAD